jgi:predicted transcriptional regulator
MRKKSAEKTRKLLTDVELEMMRVLWDLGEGSVAEVLRRLPADRKLAYTSVSTMLRILVQKRMVSSRKEGWGHLYTPLVNREAYGKASVQNLVEKVFGGAPSAMVRTLLDIEGLTQADLDAIRNLISERERDE